MLRHFGDTTAIDAEIIEGGNGVRSLDTVRDIRAADVLPRHLTTLLPRVAGAHGSNKTQGNASANLAPAFTTDTAAKTG